MITTIQELIATAESGNNPSATRYEPGFGEWVTDADVTSAMRANDCERETSQTICQTSYGLYQIMGANLYSLGLMSSVEDFMDSPTLQAHYFNLFLQSRKIASITLDDIRNDQTKREYFALKYNGNPTVYGNYLLKVLNK